MGFLLWRRRLLRSMFGSVCHGRELEKIFLSQLRKSHQFLKGATHPSNNVNPAFKVYNLTCTLLFQRRVLVDWVCNGIGVEVGALDDDSCPATGQNIDSQDFKCSTCEVCYSEAALSAVVHGDLDWHCPSCVAQGSERWGEPPPSLRPIPSDDALLVSSIRLLCQSPTKWMVEDWLVVLRSLCFVAGSTKVITAHLEVARKAEEELRRKAVDCSDESFREALRNFGGDAAAALWTQAHQVSDRSLTLECC
jgi:hypothetical protein